MAASGISTADLALLARAVRALAPLTDSDLALATGALTARALARGDHFLHAGTLATHAALVTAGVLREYYPLAGGDERTKGFAVEGDFAGSLSDLLAGVAGRASRASIVADTDARLLVLDWRALGARVAGNPRWDLFSRRTAERLYLIKAEREYELLALDAPARYAAFRARFPGLEARLSQRVVASYLGVTPEHLSRIRRRARSASLAPTTRSRKTRSKG